MTKEVRFLLVGTGNVGRRFLELVVRKRTTLHDRLGLALIPVGVADTSGAAICPPNVTDAGLDPQQLVELKAKGLGAAGYPDWGRPGLSALDMVRTVDADLLLEASPANLEDGQPGLGCIEAALSRGMHVVTANKAPLVLAFPRLLAVARDQGVKLRFDATVAGGLPAVNLGQRDLAAADVQRLEGILNLTTSYILTRMAEDGLSYAEALADAQAAGHAETDPSLDVEGWDAASKLVILAHSVLHYPAALSNVTVEGITGIDAGMLQRAAREGKRLKLIASALRQDSGYQLSVRPTLLDAGHPLAQLAAKQMGATQASLVKYMTSGDVSGDLSHVVGYAGMIVL